MGYKSGYAAVIGRPNSGKSTLINAITGEKVSIISNKPQTTRNIIKGIITDEESQIIFVDTPGIYDAENKLGEKMVRAAESLLWNADVIIYIVDVHRRGYLKDSEYIISLLKKISSPVILVLNKIDLLASKSDILPIIEAFSGKLEFYGIIPVSARNNDGTSLVHKTIKELLPEGESIYPEEIYTDQTEKFLVSEIIREKLFESLGDEIPYGVHVDVVRFNENPNNGVIELMADIYCEKSGHKAIIIGKNGSHLKKIGTRAREDIEKVLAAKVYLQLWVKARNEWRDDENFLRRLGL